MKRILLFGLLGGLLATGPGCGLMQAVFYYRPCVTRGDCAEGYGYYNGRCGEDCEGSCGPSWEPTRPPAFAPRPALVSDDCEVDCGLPCRDPNCRSCAPRFDPCSDPCGESCYGRCWHRGPLSCLFSLMFRGCWWGPSCGERYWGDFYSDPPDCWDPCDCYGNYTGGGCCDYGGYGDPTGYTHGYAGDGMPMAKERIVSQTDRVAPPVSKAASRPHKAARR